MESSRGHDLAFHIDIGGYRFAGPVSSIDVHGPTNARNENIAGRERSRAPWEISRPPFSE